MGLTTAINQAIATAPDTLSGAARLLKDGAVIGSWRVLALIGHGGNGEVYRVQHVKSNAIGALKLLHQDTPHQRLRFELESEILQKISSYTSKGTQHFPHLLDKGNIADRNIPYVVIEFLQEFKLPSPHEPRMKEAEIGKLMLGVCEGIRELHKNGYLHRDIKSENLMQRENGEIVLIDFGFAIRIADIEDPFADRVSVTQGRKLGVGTPGSTAPEQAFGMTSISSDVYALGALANECFRGEPPTQWIPVIQKATSPNDTFRYHNIETFESAICNCIRETQDEPGRNEYANKILFAKKKRATLIRRVKKVILLCLGLSAGLFAILFIAALFIPADEPVALNNSSIDLWQKREDDTMRDFLKDAVPEEMSYIDGQGIPVTCLPRDWKKMQDNITSKVEIVDGTKWHYEIDQIKTRIVKGECSGSVIIPQTLGGRKVTTIGAGAFKGCSNITAVTIPNGVTLIGRHAFDDCFAMEKLIIPSSVKKIGDYAFQGCKKLKSLTIPAGVTDIGICAFFSCDNLTSITLSSTVKNIGVNAFKYCPLKTIYTATNDSARVKELLEKRGVFIMNDHKSIQIIEAK